MLISGAGHGTSQFFTNSNLDVLAAFLDTHLKNTSDVDESKYESQVKEIKLSQNYPNPFNNRTVIKFELPVPGMTSIKIFNVAGKEVSTLINEELSAGHHQIVFDAANLASGEYYYQMRSGDFYQTRIFTLVAYSGKTCHPFRLKVYHFLYGTFSVNNLRPVAVFSRKAC